MTEHTAAESDVRFRTWWRVDANRNIKRAYRKGWQVAHMAVDGERVMVILTRVTPPEGGPS